MVPRFSNPTLIAVASRLAWEHFDLPEEIPEALLDRWCCALYLLAEERWQPDDTEESLFRRVVDLLPIPPDDHPPWEQPEGEGWPALMAHMRGGPDQTSPRVAKALALARSPLSGESG